MFDLGGNTTPQWGDPPLCVRARCVSIRHDARIGCLACLGAGLAVRLHSVVGFWAWRDGSGCFKAATACCGARTWRATSFHPPAMPASRWTCWAATRCPALGLVFLRFARSLDKSSGA